MTAATKKKDMVLVGCKTLSADIVKIGDPIVYGEKVSVSGDALAYTENTMYEDSIGQEHNMFVSADSAIGKRVLGLDDSGKQPAPRRARTRRRR